MSHASQAGKRRGDRMTVLGDAFAHYGRIFKTLHLIRLIDSEACRRMFVFS